MIRAAGLEGRELTAGRIGFILAPRLNAAGRLGSALRGVELMLSENESIANPIARELEELNATRQEIDRATLEQARERVLQMDLSSTYGIVLAEHGWHPGVIGIVASRIVEEFGRPTILVALDGGEGKGSGRSISMFDLHGGLTQCRDLLMRFGGHKAAAGITVSAERVAEFTARFNEVCASQLTQDDLVPELRVDLELPFDRADAELETLLRYMEPCGVGNPSPLFVARGVTVVAPPRVVGKDGLKLVLKANGRELVALGWGMAPRAPEIEQGATIDVAFRLELDAYRDETRLQARLADFRAS
jgi:single-stranded-DNA-specific exonuclease